MSDSSQNLINCSAQGLLIYRHKHSHIRSRTTAKSNQGPFDLWTQSFKPIPERGERRRKTHPRTRKIHQHKHLWLTAETPAARCLPEKPRNQSGVTAHYSNMCYRPPAGRFRFHSKGFMSDFKLLYSHHVISSLRHCLGISPPPSPPPCFIWNTSSSLCLIKLYILMVYICKTPHLGC